VPGIVSLTSPKPGPHLGITALVHGNEICGLMALAKLLAERPNLKRGRLSLILANPDALCGAINANPPGERALAEDFNRLWDPQTLDGPRTSRELTRARALRPFIQSLDHLLDLHSMSRPAEPMILAGRRTKNLILAQGLGLPYPIILDDGHISGRRLRDFGAFDDDNLPNTACLIECGGHIEARSIETAVQTCRRYLGYFDLLDSADDACGQMSGPIISITDVITPTTPDFHFTRDFGGLEIIDQAGTVFAQDQTQIFTTPYENCALVMPVKRIAMGQTAVRLGRFQDLRG
jgi:succinylglutamate desuccinylase